LVGDDDGAWAAVAVAVGECGPRMGASAEGPEEKCEGKDWARRGPGGTAKDVTGGCTGSGRSGMLRCLRHQGPGLDEVKRAGVDTSNQNETQAYLPMTVLLRKNLWR
jgi:hypothetical protein